MRSRSRIGQRGGSGATELSSILPKNSFYPVNTNIVPNSADSRAIVMNPHHQQQQQQQQQRGGKRKQRNKLSRSKRGYVNYAGRQIGCLSRSHRRRSHRRRSQRQSQRQRQTRTQLQRRAQLQSGGDAFSYLPQDVNMAAQSATTFVSNLWSDLQGTHNTVSPLPFSDQAIHSTSSGSNKP